MENPFLISPSELSVKSLDPDTLRLLWHDADAREVRLRQVIAERLAASGAKDIPPGSLLERCTGRTAGVEAFDATGRLGLLHMAFPLKMLLQSDGHLTTTDLLHTVAGAILFDVYENQDVRLIALQI